MPKACAFRCNQSGVPMHCFPNYEKFPERFKTWVTLCGGKLQNFSDYKIYIKKKVCDRHFTDKDRNRNKRLNALAVPSLYLSGFFSSHDNHIRLDHNYGLHRKNIYSLSKIGEDNVVLHLFPNPEKDPERFDLWCSILGGNLLKLNKDIVYKNRRVCHNHFATKYHTWSKRISSNSVPTIDVPGFTDLSTSQPNS